MRERLNGIEQGLGAEYTQHAGTPNRGVIYRVRTGHGARMRRCRTRALRRPAGFDHQHRLTASGGACGGHKFAGLPYIFDVQQDRGGVRIAGKIVEYVTEINIIGVTE